jgi:hypothetical protein
MFVTTDGSVDLWKLGALVRRRRTYERRFVILGAGVVKSKANDLIPTQRIPLPRP